MRKTGKILLIGGWAHPAEAMRPLANALEPSFACECLSVHDLDRGPDRTATAGRGRYAAALRARLDAGPPCTVLGWSMGGIVAMEAAAGRAPHLRGLVLLGATPRFCRAAGFPHGIAERNLRALRAALASQPESALNRFFDDAAYPRLLSPAARALAVEQALCLGTAALRRGLDYLRLTDLRARLTGIRLPCLVLHGADDRIVPATASEALARNPAGARRCLPGGHLLPLLSPAAVAGEVAAFLRGAHV